MGEGPSESGGQYLILWAILAPSTLRRLPTALPRPGMLVFWPEVRVMGNMVQDGVAGLACYTHDRSRGYLATYYRISPARKPRVAQRMLGHQSREDSAPIQQFLALILVPPLGCHCSMGPLGFFLVPCAG